VGLTTKAARQGGFDPVSVLVVQADRAHFYPTQDLMYLKLVVDRPTRRVLGLLGVGSAGDALSARIDAVAALMPYQPTVDEVSNLELAYSPPFAAAMDILNAAANTAENALDGRLKVISPEEFARRLHDPADKTVFLDLRAIGNARPYLEALSDRGWRHLPQETLSGRLGEVPRDQDVILICNSGVRSYEAQVTLTEAGFGRTYNLEGGIAAVKKWGEPIIPPGEE
jgi:rhodanese-related sulfurtransferase